MCNFIRIHHNPNLARLSKVFQFELNSKFISIDCQLLTFPSCFFPYEPQPSHY